MDSKKVKAIKSLLLHVTDKHNPKFELNGILVQENKLVYTDTKQLLILEFKEKFLKEEPEHTIMIFEQLPFKEWNNTKRPEQFLELIDANNGFLDELGLKLCVPYNKETYRNKLLDGTFEEKTSERYAKFPDYKRLEIKDSDKVKTEELNFQNMPLDADYIFLKSVMLNQAFFDTKIFLKFLQLLTKCSNITKACIRQAKNEPAMPLMIECEINTSNEEAILVKYLVMPCLC